MKIKQKAIESVMIIRKCNNKEAEKYCFDKASSFIKHQEEDELYENRKIMNKFWWKTDWIDLFIIEDWDVVDYKKLRCKKD